MSKKQNNINNARMQQPIVSEYGRDYVCEISSGAGTNSSVTETGFCVATIQVAGNRIKINKHVEKTGINISSSIWTVSSAFFLMFFVLALGFNIIFYTLVKSDDLLIAPKILLGIFLAVGFFPTVISFSRAPRRLKIDFDSYDYMRILFKTIADKKRFIQEFQLPQMLEENSFIADVNTVERFYSNATVVPISKKCFKLISKGEERTVRFLKKRGNSLWFLYLFFLVFIVVPPLAIISSLINGSFEVGMLSTIILLVVGIAGMFLPGVLSSGTLTLATKLKDITLSFPNKKQCKIFSRQLKGRDNSLEQKDNKTKKRMNTLHDYRKKYAILDEQDRLTNVVPILILVIVSLFLLVAVIVIAISSFDIVSFIIMLLVALVFTSIAIFLMKENFRIIKKRLHLKKSVKFGKTVPGTIIECETKLFKIASRTYYFAQLTIAFNDENGTSRTKVLNRMFKKDKKFCEGQTLLISSYDDVYAAIEPLEKNNITSENESLYALNASIDKYDEKLLAYTEKDFYKLDCTKPYKVLFKRLVYQLIALSSLFPFFVLILAISISAIAHNPDDNAQITIAVILMCVVGLPLLTAIITLFIQLICRVVKRIQIKRMLKVATISYGIVTDVEKRTILRHSNNGNYTQTRIFANIRYIDLNRNIKTICFYENDRSILAREFIKGQQVAIAFQNDKTAILTECSTFNSGVPVFTEQEAVFIDSLKSLENKLKIKHPKSEVILSAYIVYALIFAIIGGIIVTINLALFDNVSDLVLRIIMYLSFSSIGLILLGFSLLILFTGIKRYVNARKILSFCDFSYALVYKNDASSSMFKRLPYIYVDRFGNPRRHYTKEIFFQFKYIKFASHDIFSAITHSTSIFMPPQLIEHDNIQLAIVAYNKYGSVLLRPKSIAND